MGKKLFNTGVRGFKYYSNEELLAYSFGLGTLVYVIESFINLFPGSGMYGSLLWGSKIAVLNLVIKYLASNQIKELKFNFKYRSA